MAELLSQEGFQFHGTTVAKIEAGDRTVSVAEAAAFAGIFGVSLDSLLGRNVNLENDLTYAVHGLQEAARQVADQITAAAHLFAARADDVIAFDFEDRDALLQPLGEACRSLVLADLALAKLRRFDLPADLSVHLAEKVPNFVDKIIARATEDIDPEGVS